MKVVIRPLTKAKVGVVNAPRKDQPKRIEALAPTAAPEETPTTPGSASGLPKTPCIIAPATASAAPTRTVMTTRGKRTCHRASSPKSWLGPGSQSSPTLFRSEPTTSSGGMKS